METTDPADVCVWAAREMRAIARSLVREAAQLELEHAHETARALKRIALRQIRAAVFVMKSK